MKQTNNTGYVAPDEDPVITAFQHWTSDVTNMVLMVADLQGFKHAVKRSSGQQNGLNEPSTIWKLTDPCVLCPRSPGLMDFFEKDRGGYGVLEFFQTHTCNDVCGALGLNPAAECREQIRGIIEEVKSGRPGSEESGAEDAPAPDAVQHPDAELLVGSSAGQGQHATTAYGTPHADGQAEPGMREHLLQPSDSEPGGSSSGHEHHAAAACEAPYANEQAAREVREPLLHLVQQIHPEHADKITEEILKLPRRKVARLMESSRPLQLTVRKILNALDLNNTAVSNDG